MKIGARQYVWQKKVKNEKEVEKKMDEKSTLTGIEDCDVLIYEYLDMKSLKTMASVDKWARKLKNKCAKSNSFWNHKVEKLYHLYSKDMSYNYLNICYFLSKYTGDQRNRILQGWMPDKVLQKQILQLFFDNNIYVLEPYRGVIKNNSIKSVDYGDNESDTIFIHFTKDVGSLKLYAGAECCSSSWFEKLEYPFTDLVGREITCIEDVSYIDMADDNDPRFDHIQNHLIRITLVPLSSQPNVFEFVLRNNSNGYYDGSLSISVEKK